MSTPRLPEQAEFFAQLPGGGEFRATWPRTITVPDLKMLRGMLGLTLDWWIEKVETERAGETEYASWAAIRSLPDPSATPQDQGGER